MWLALALSLASGGVAASWCDVAAQQGRRVGLFLLSSGGLKGVVEGWGGGLVGVVLRLLGSLETSCAGFVLLSAAQWLSAVVVLLLQSKSSAASMLSVVSSPSWMDQE